MYKTANISNKKRLLAFQIQLYPDGDEHARKWIVKTIKKIPENHVFAFKIAL